MPEQAPFITDEVESLSRTNKDIYNQYKEGVDRAEERKTWLEDKSYKGVVKRAINTAVKTLLVQSPNMESYDDLAAPYFAKENAKHHLENNVEAVKLDAIHDATAAGAALNLPESGLPETVTNVQPFPEQVQPKHN